MKNISSFLLCLFIIISFFSLHQKALAVNGGAQNMPPTSPTITGPTTRAANQDGMYGFTSTDPEGDTLHYEIDWDNNGTVDQTLPAGYVPSGTTMSQANNWAGPGVKIFEARAVDNIGTTSGWTSYSVTINCLPGAYETPTATCNACNPGSYCTGTNLPFTCPVNTYCTGGNTQPTATNPPTPCPAGQGSPTGSTNVGACTVITTSLTSSPSSCSIATGANSCGVTLNWITGGSLSTVSSTVSSVTTNNPLPNTVVYSANSGSELTQIPYAISRNVTYYLYHDALEIASTTVAVSCAAGVNNFDTIGGVCANPQVGTVTVTGDYFINPATIDFTCLLSDRYQVTRTTPLGDIITISSGPYTGPASTTVTVQDNYKVICKHGSVEASQTFLYHYPAPDPVVSIEAHPKTTGSEGSSLISWSIPFPTVSCTLTASAVCANNLCTNAQLATAALLNTAIAAESTDANDPQTSRAITTAVNTIAPGHEITDHKALGRKTFHIQKSTDFMIDCGNGKKASTRIRKANNNEQ